MVGIKVNTQPSVSQKTVSFVCIENGNGNERTWCLMPSFDVLVASLVGFTSNENLGDEAALWCKFVSAFPNAYPGKRGASGQFRQRMRTLKRISVGIAFIAIRG